MAGNNYLTMYFSGLAWVPNGELLTLDHTMGNLVVFSQSGKKTHQARFQPIYQPGIREPRCRFIDVNMAKAYPIVVVSDLGQLGSDPRLFCASFTLIIIDDLISNRCKI